MVSTDDRRTLLLSGAGLGFLFAAVLAGMAWQDYSHASILLTPPVQMTLKDALSQDAVSRRHVTITNFVFGGGYTYETGAAAWTSVSVPLFPIDSKNADEVGAILNSWDIRNEQQLDEVLNQSELTGILGNGPDGIGITRSSLLREANPGMHVNQVWTLHYFRNPPRMEQIRLAAGGSILSFVAGGICLWLRRRDVARHRGQNLER